MPTNYTVLIRALVVLALFIAPAMAQTVQNYTVLDPNGNVVNIILWDGDTTKWSPTAAYGAGYTVRPTQPGDQIAQPAAGN